MQGYQPGWPLRPSLVFPAHSRIIPCIGKTDTIRQSRRSRASVPVSHEHRPQPTDVRLGRIVRLLMEHATVVVSGTKIAQEISSTRSEVWRLIQQLRGLGVDVAEALPTGDQRRAGPASLLSGIFPPPLRRTPSP